MPTPSSLTDRHQPIILFDGVCVLCSGFVRFVIARDPAARFRFAAVQSKPGRCHLTELGRPLEEWESNALIEDGVAYFKSTAFLRIARRLSAPWPVVGLLGHLLPLALCDWLYDRIAQNRYWLFGRRETCLVPGPEIRPRFLE